MRIKIVLLEKSPKSCNGNLRALKLIVLRMKILAAAAAAAASDARL